MSFVALANLSDEPENSGFAIATLFCRIAKLLHVRTSPLYHRGGGGGGGGEGKRGGGG
jgi:hypothetical protein